MILVVNLNLAVDEIVHLEGLRLGGVHRTADVERLAGGKGVNVARVLKALKEEAVLTGFLGGRAGDFIARELQREELHFDCTPIQRESRTCIILDDRSTRTQTVINEAGPQIYEDEHAAFHERYMQLLSASDLIITTGSLPPNLPPDVYANLIRAANEQGKRVLLDTSGEALRSALSARPFIVKVNGAEAGAHLGLRIKDFDDATAAARRLIEEGAQHAMITLGASGAALNFEGTEYRMRPPRVEAQNSVGSGDAVMAGLAASLMRGLGAKEMARRSVAAGAANALRGAGRCRPQDIHALAREVEFA